MCCLFWEGNIGEVCEVLIVGVILNEREKCGTRDDTEGIVKNTYRTTLSLRNAIYSRASILIKDVIPMG